MASEALKRAARENGKLGGRKKGLASIEREKAKEYIAIRIGEYMPQLFDALLTKALEGEVNAAKELFDRAWGKAHELKDLNVNVKVSLRELALKALESGNLEND